MSEQTYFVMRKNSSGVERKAWVSPVTGIMFCGICLRGEIHAEIGARCTKCESEVVRKFEALDGGISRPAYTAIRAERRRREAGRAAAADRQGKILTMRAS